MKASYIKIRSSARKLNLVASMVRNMSVSDAMVQLTFLNKKVAADIKKCLQSCVANAENNFNKDIDNLYISNISVGKSLVMRRFRARAKGRSASIKKPYSNLYLELSEKEEVK